VTLAKVFGVSDQNHFALLSGDANPMHMDPVAARRTQAGAPVVHGVHAVLWALDSLIAGGHLRGSIASLSVRFQKFTYVGAGVELRIASANATSLRAKLVSEGITTTVIDIAYGEQEPAPDARLSSQLIDLSQPAELDISNIAGRAGCLQIASPGAIAQMFPHAASALGSERIAAIAGLSALVGMVCPGLHSIFSGFAIRMTHESDPGLSFRVRNVDERFRMIELAVAGGGIAGEVTAFLRQPPVAQAGVEELRSLVEPGEFVSVTALVVGGSRGLGALTAKIIAAGGGRVAITYASGEDDALAIAREIGPESISVFRYDVRENAETQITALPWDVNQLYYFATPHIFRQKAGGYSAARFAEFYAFYVDGFASLCTALRARSAHGFAAFYPSSTAIEERPRDMTEYAMAKAAGEALCADMKRFAPDIHVVVKRLPRLLTDQTATVMPVEQVNPLESMLPIVREMSAISLVR
jgi:acyl dehydratase